MNPVNAMHFPIEQILENTEKFLTNNKSSNTKLSNNLLGRFGFQNSNDVIMFLNSTEGKIAVRLVMEELHLREKNIENIRQAIHQIELQKQIRIGLLILSLMYQQERYHHIESFLAEEKEAKKKLVDSNKKLLAENSANLTPQNIKDYTEAVKVIETVKQEKVKAIKKLEAQIAKCDQQIQQLYQEHAVTTQAIDAIYTAYDSLVSRVEMDDNMGARTDYIESIERHLTQLQDDISFHEQNILDTESDSGYDTDTTSSDGIPVLDTKHLQLQRQRNISSSLEQILSVLRGEQYFSNESGEACSHTSKAFYLVPSNKVVARVINSKGEQEFYLVPRGTSLDDMSPEAKANAKSEFTQLPLFTKVALKNEINRKIEEYNDQKAQCVSLCKTYREDIECLNKAENKLLSSLKPSDQAKVMSATMQELRNQQTQEETNTNNYTSPNPFRTTFKPTRN